MLTRFLTASLLLQLKKQVFSSKPLLLLQLKVMLFSWSQRQKNWNWALGKFFWGSLKLTLNFRSWKDLFAMWKNWQSQFSPDLSSYTLKLKLKLDLLYCHNLLVRNNWKRSNYSDIRVLQMILKNLLLLCQITCRYWIFLQTVKKPNNFW